MRNYWGGIVDKKKFEFISHLNRIIVFWNFSDEEYDISFHVLKEGEEHFRNYWSEMKV